VSVYNGELILSIFGETLTSVCPSEVGVRSQLPCLHK